jgi:hypothetical protein
MLDQHGIEVSESFQYSTRIIRLAAGIQNRQQAAAQQWIQTAFAATAQLVDLKTRQDFKTALRPDLSIDSLDPGRSFCAYLNGLLQSTRPGSPFPLNFSAADIVVRNVVRNVARNSDAFDDSGSNFDQRIVSRHQPDVDHVGIGDGNAAVGPILSAIVCLGFGRRIWLSVNHDCAAGLYAYALRITSILLVGVGHMDRQKKIA